MGKMIDRRNWRFPTEKIISENERKKQGDRKGNHDQLAADDRDANKLMTKKCNLTLV